MSINTISSMPKINEMLEIINLILGQWNASNNICIKLEKVDVKKNNPKSIIMVSDKLLKSSSKTKRR